MLLGREHLRQAVRRMGEGYGGDGITVGIAGCSKVLAQASLASRALQGRGSCGNSNRVGLL